MQRPAGSRPHSPGPCTERDDRPTCHDHVPCVLGRSATTGPSPPRTVPQCRTGRAGTTTELRSGTRRHRMAAGRARSTRTEHAVQTSPLRLDERVRLAHRSLSFAKKTAAFRSTWFVSACSAAGLRSRRSSSRSAVGSSRCPCQRSVSSCLVQFRRPSALTPSCRATSVTVFPEERSSAAASSLPRPSLRVHDSGSERRHGVDASAPIPSLSAREPSCTRRRREAVGADRRPHPPLPRRGQSAHNQRRRTSGIEWATSHSINTSRYTRCTRGSCRLPVRKLSMCRQSSHVTCFPSDADHVER